MTPAECSTSNAPSPSIPRAVPSTGRSAADTRTRRPRSASRCAHRAAKAASPQARYCSQASRIASAACPASALRPGTRPNAVAKSVHG